MFRIKIIRINLVLISLYLFSLYIYYSYGDFNVLSIIQSIQKKIVKKFNLGKTKNIFFYVKTFDIINVFNFKAMLE